MKTKATLLNLMIILISIQLAISQDQIYKLTNEVIVCKIQEIGLDEIKYQLPDRKDNIIFSMNKNLISKIILENGDEIVFKDEFKNPENYIDNNKNALKIEFLSPLTGNTTFSYERSRNLGKSFEISFGIIGLGVDANQNNPVGFFIKSGTKFIKSSDFYLTGMRYAHLLKGSYLKPEIAFGYFSRYYREFNFFSRSKTTRENFYSGAIFLNLGKQWIYDNSFLIDFYIGVGYGVDTAPTEGGYYYGYVIGTDEFPIALQAGLKIGLLF